MAVKPGRRTSLDYALANQAANLKGYTPLMPGVFKPHIRSIGGIAVHVTVEEEHRDEVTVTEHPVEQGAPIADHAFLRQKEVTMKCGWNLWDGDLSAENGIYGLLLWLQASFQLFDLNTGKRIYRNMLITSMTVQTNQETEYALMVTLTCREVILTSTTIQPPATSGNDGDKASPGENGTGQTTERGTQQPTEVTNGAVTSSVEEEVDPTTTTIIMRNLDGTPIPEGPPAPTPEMRALRQRMRRQLGHRRVRTQRPQERLPVPAITRRW